MYTTYVVITDEVTEVERDEYLRLFSHRPVSPGEATRWLRQWMRDTKMKQPDIEELPGFEELFQKTIEKNLKATLEAMPPEERLAGLAPEQVLGAFAPEQRLAGLAPEQRLAGLAPEQVLGAFAPEQVLGTFAPEQRLAGLAPEQVLLALPVETLRALPEEYLRTLPVEVQEQVRKRLQGATH